MDPESVPKTALVTQSQQYEFLWLPFGLKNSAATFQWLINTILAEHIEKICFIYIDDIVIYSSDTSTQLQHLQQVFACLQEAGLTPNIRKCQLCQNSLSFLGHVISWEGIRTKVDKVKAIQMFPMPTNIKELSCQKEGDAPPALLNTVTNVSWSIPDDCEKLGEFQHADESLKPLWQLTQKPLHPDHIQYTVRNK